MTEQAVARELHATAETTVEPGLRRAGVRPEVQALRAVAVILVVAYHLWPEWIDGGFAGVDVFFVISGFLITDHLARELTATGRIRLPAFYARRARRLLPAALTVLLVSAVGVFVILPITLWERSFRELAASALYFENWSLARSSVSYFAAEDPPTVVQHFWSLSVEEQFYLGWPLIFLLTAVLADRVRAGTGSRRWVLAAGPALVLALSFSWSALHHGSAAEYFSTFTRAWEFAAGGLLALATGSGLSRRLSPSGRLGRVGRHWRVPASWAGWAVILGAGLLLSETMRFPGWVAVFPVLGTVAVIAAGTPSSRSGPTRWVRSRPVQFIGGISYSLYLWHWPVIILFGRVPGGTQDSGVSRVVLLGVSVLLAVASTYLIEVPLRRPVPRRAGTGLTLGLAAAGMAAVCAVTVVGLGQVQSERTEAARQVQAVRDRPPECFGAAALDPLRPACREQARRSRSGTPVPNPIAAFEDKSGSCMQALDRAEVKACSTGPRVADAAAEVAVIGDSHAAAWTPALREIARQRGWRLTALLKQSCPLTEAVREMPRTAANSCVDWNAEVPRWLARHPRIHQVFVSASSFNGFVPEDGRNAQQTAVRGYRRGWDRLPDSVTRIVVLRDVPRPRGDVVACSASATSQGQNVRTCGRSTAKAVLLDPQVEAAAQSARKPTVIDLTRYFCVDGYCSPEVGGAFVYRDGHHMTATFARTLAPYVRP